MRSIFLSGLLISFGCLSACAQGILDDDLARTLADPSTRSDALATVAASGQSKTPLLLSWVLRPPTGVDSFELSIGLADAFGQLKTKEAMPFLIKNISIQRWVATPNIWMKTAQVIEERLPAAAALIRVGPGASRVLIRTYPDLAKADDRLAAIFVVSRISGVPAAREFLLDAVGEANLARHWAEEGIRLVGKPQ